MLNFKLIKRASFVLVLFVGVFWSSGAALAGFVSTSVQDDEKNFNAAAATIEAIPTKTDGEIVDCFDYYRFPSIQTSFETLKEFYEPGQTVYFKGELINENNYPIADGYLFVRIARFNENYTKEGHDIVDEFFAKSGPQGNEKFYLENKEKKGTVLSWNVPENLAEGDYVASFSFVVGKKMNLAGLSFTNEVNAGLTMFEIGKSARGVKRVFLEKSSFAVNGKKYDHIGLSPVFGKGAKVEISGKLKNETLKKENVKLVYDLYYWDGLDDKNKISSQSEEITVASNSSHSFKYVIPKMDETVYFLRITAIAGNNQKSIVNLRLLSEQERPRINFFSPLKFPVLKGETMTSFACFHNTADKAGRGKMTMSIFDESGDKIQTLGYEGKITGRIMAVKKDIVAAKNYDYLKMGASVVGADGREADSYEMIYDCKNMNPKNQECVKIQEEKIKTITDASNKPFDKKDVAVGIIALLGIMAVAALLRKFFINKAKPPLMFLLFALAVGSAVFLASGIGDYASAKDVTRIENYNFPPNVDCNKNVQGKGIYVGPIWDGDPLWICASGSIQIMDEVIVIENIRSNTLDIGKSITFSYRQHDPYYYTTSGANDSPFGEWCDDLSDKSCLIYEQVGYIGKNDQATKKDNIDMTWLALKPTVSMTSSDSSVIACDGMVCTAQRKGTATLTANIGKVTARPWIKLYAWEGWNLDYKGDEKMNDIDFNSATLIWDFTVDPGTPTCTASFSSAEISAGESTKFSWETTGDQDGLIPITCTDSTYNPPAPVHTSGYFSISPDSDQTCTATASNNDGLNVKSCSAEIIVSPKETTEILTVEIYGEKWTDGSTVAGGTVSGTNGFNCVGEKTTDSGINVGADKLLQTCEKKYNQDSNVDLYASPAGDCPASGCGFKKWDGACSGANCSFTMDTSKNVSAYFKVTQGLNDGSGEPPPVIPPPVIPPPVIPPPVVLADPDTYNLTFKTSGSGSGNATRYAYDDTWGWSQSKVMNNGDKDGIGRDWKFKLVPNPSSGSYFSSWSGCGSVNSDNECLLEKNPYPGADKTVTATFTSSSGPTGECPGCAGGSSVKAYISARDTVVTDGNSTVVTWTSDNANSCEQKEGGNDTGWLSASDTALGSYTTSNFTTSGGPRTYKVTCINGSQSADAEVTVSVGDYKDSPSVTMWADPQSIGYKKTAFVQWLSSNVFPNSCLLFSVSDTMNGYLSYFNFSSKQFFGPGYYKSEIGENNSTGQKTGKLSGDTTYKIQCGGYGPSWTKVTAQTTVAVAKPVSNFTLTNPAGASLVATIVEGLSANSSSIALSLSGEAIGNVSLSAVITAISGAKAQFSSDNGTTWSDALSADISAISEVKMRVIKIPGATPAGTYNTAITATDTGTGGKTKKLNINLRVDRVSSEWKEF